MKKVLIVSALFLGISGAVSAQARTSKEIKDKKAGISAVESSTAATPEISERDANAGQPAEKQVTLDKHGNKAGSAAAQEAVKAEQMDLENAPAAPAKKN